MQWLRRVCNPNGAVTKQIKKESNVLAADSLSQIRTKNRHWVLQEEIDRVQWTNRHEEMSAEC